MMLKKINKKAVVGSGMTWVVATIMVFFILVIFLAVTYLFNSHKNSIDFENKALESKLESFRAQEVLIQKLNSFVEYKGEKYVLEDFILKTFEPYLKDDEFMQSYDIYDLDSFVNQKELFTKFYIRNNFKGDFSREEQEKFAVIKQALDDECYDFILKTPFAAFYQLGDAQGFGRNNAFQVESNWNFNSFTSLKIPYGRYLIKLNFKIKEKC